MLIAGCTTLRPLDTSSGEAQVPQRLSTLIEPGDYTEIITTDGMSHDLRVVSVSGAGGAARPWVASNSYVLDATVATLLEEIRSIGRFEVDSRRAAINAGKDVGLVIVGAVALAVLVVVVLAGGV
jgi:hypothetical protein